MRNLATELNVSLAAIKARWRSTFARIAVAMPGLVEQTGGESGRGSQKRNRVLTYVRSHPEELRPYVWKKKQSPPMNSNQVSGSNETSSA